MKIQQLHDRVLEDAKELVASIERYNHENAYGKAKSVCKQLLNILEEEMYSDNDNAEMYNQI